ncbi:MAG: PaREP1 family protein, partial [Candidatus Njordarchaeales archaeon]
MEIILPERVKRKIIEESKRRGINLEEYIAEIIVDHVSQNPEDKVELYLKLCEKYLKDAEDMLRKGDSIQASEKMWGAAA